MKPLIDQHLLQKFRQDQCTPGEYRIVLEWFSTDEGKRYLEESIMLDLEEGNGSDVTAPPALYENVMHTLFYKPRRRIRTLLKVAAVTAGLIVMTYAGVSFYHYQQLKVIHTAYGELRTVVLPDQSVITLNANSTLRYYDNWKHVKNREVWIEGEAWFSVHPTPVPRPFLVNTASRMQVEVLGTTFNLIDRHGRMQVVLNSGKVRLHSSKEPEKSIVMQPGDLVEFKQQEQTMQRKHADTLTYTSWTKRNLHFENATFAQLAQQLEDTYGVSVEIRDSSLLRQQFTGTVPGQQMNMLLDGLSELFHVKITKENNKVIIEKK
ncbi:FecR domain-containing protein [Chitinophaga sp.]|uniref:FecR family protein n=1 Tax=Chitinophaga sp. TaxID=1869181 RepID=UPI0031D7DBF6